MKPGDASRRLEALLAEPPPLLPDEEVHALLSRFLARRDIFLDLARREGTPLYVFDEEALRDRAERFVRAFAAELPGFHAFFAMKCNNHPRVAKTLVAEGLGLDASSGEELALALDAGAKRIVFTGPAKGAGELAQAADNAARVTVMMDSFAEIPRLGEAARRAGTRIAAGVRLTTDERGLWRKFGIPQARLADFIEAASREEGIDFSGLHFHTSWNLTPDAHTTFLDRLGKTLAALPPASRAKLRFLDVGGGYWPEGGEWLSPGGSAWGRAALDFAPDLLAGRPRHRLPAASIETFAARIGEAVRRHVLPHAEVDLWAEPGRWIAHECMHFLLTVADAKDEDILICDGGTNLVGWERYEHDWFPVANLTRPGLAEHPRLVLGALCTPHDLWGTSLFGGEPPRVGDLLLLPCQGAYTWSLRQHFIKPVAPVATLPAKTNP